jgi:protein phosphatase
MGGTTGGTVASTIVLQAAREFLEGRFAAPVHSSQLKEILREAYARADAALKQEQTARPHLAGMGTTLASVLALGERFVVANIGDSRVFRLTSGRFDQITVDHSYIQEMMARSGVKPDPALLRQFGHVLNRSIQGNGDHPDLFPKRKKWFTLDEGDGFLLCSDGLILDKSADGEPGLGRQLREAPTLKQCAEAMVAGALASGSGDNITVIVAKWGPSADRPTEPVERDPAVCAEGVIPHPGRDGFRRRTLILTVALFILAAGLIALGLHACGSAAESPAATAHPWSSI